MRNNVVKSIALLAGLLLAVQVQAADAIPLTLSFYGITGNDPNAVADGVANLKMQVSARGNQQVSFRFTNDSDHSSLTDVYFDDGALLGISGISFSSGVVFSQGASPPNLPGGNGLTPAFETTADFLADSNPSVSPNGVQKGEWLAIDFELKAGKSFADVLAALTLPSGGDWLRVGLHVQSFSGGSSESFINNPVVAIPEPDDYVLFLAGLGLLGAVARRQVRI